jgi:DNA polymerase-4
VLPGREPQFLSPLPIERLWGVGPASAAKLHRSGFETVGQLARRSEAELIAILGKASGRQVHALARNRDARPVRRRRGRRSIGSQSAFGRSPRTPAALDVILVSLVDRVARRMRASGCTGRTVILRLRFGDFSRASRSRTLHQATAATEAILATARFLLAAALPVIERRGITLLGITISNLAGVRGVTQLELPLDACDRSALDGAVDEIRERFGPGALTRASLLGRGERFSPTLMPGDRP